MTKYEKLICEFRWEKDGRDWELQVRPQGSKDWLSLDISIIDEDGEYSVWNLNCFTMPIVLGYGIETLEEAKQIVWSWLTGSKDEKTITNNNKDKGNLER